MASSNTILQTIVDEDKRGRVMSFYATAFLGLAPLGALGGGLLAQAVGASPAVGADPNLAAFLGRFHVGASLTVAAGGVVCVAAAALFRLRLERIREHIRPIYRRMGILPEVADGIQQASDPRTGVFEAAHPAAEAEEGIQRIGEIRAAPKE